MRYSVKVNLQSLGQGPRVSWEGLGRHTGGLHCWVVSGRPLVGERHVCARLRVCVAWRMGWEWGTYVHAFVCAVARRCGRTGPASVKRTWALGDLVQIPPVGLTSGTSGRSLDPREASVCSSVKWAGHTAEEDGPAGHPLRASASPRPSNLLRPPWTAPSGSRPGCGCYGRHP